jgi:hypothetical protein
MNCYDARRRTGTEIWHYTSANRRTGTHAVGYCAERVGCECGTLANGYSKDPDCKICGGTGWVANPEYCGGHATAEEARYCFARWLFDGTEERSYSTWHGCQHAEDGKHCDAPTKMALETRRPLGQAYFLCDEHRNLGVLKALAPYDAGQIMASW